jgi:hypothetical protein
MPALVLYLLLGWNYSRHRRGLSTICSSHRPFIGPRLFVIGWGGLTAFMIHHYCRPFRRAVVAALEAFDDDCSTLQSEEI